MFIQLCKELCFPPESLPVFEKAYVTVKENSEINALFEAAQKSLLHPNIVAFKEATEKITEITDIHPYTLNVLLCVSSLDSLRKAHKEAGMEERLDAETGRLCGEILSCKKNFGVWGVKKGFWQWMFHELNCITLGRLEYEPFHHFRDIQYGGIKKGDPVILIHIPGGSPLNMDEVEESLERAYDYFKGRFDGETVPFITHSWLIYPPFLNGVFKEGGNVQKFAKLFDIIDENTSEFHNFPNVFGCAYPGENLSKVPQETTLQRNMLKYIMQGNFMGEGYGIFFYGKNGIVKNNSVT